MAVAHVITTPWVFGTAAVTPTLPAEIKAGHLVAITLISKYDDAVLAADPSGWTSIGAGKTTSKAPGNDSGNLRARAFYRVWQTGDSMPTLNPTPNNVSAVKATAFSISAGSTFDVAGLLIADDTAGTPMSLSGILDLAAGDIFSFDVALNGDAPTFGTSTVTSTGVTFGTATANVADASTTLGTDMRVRSQRRPVNSGTSASTTVSTALGGTVTNALGVGLFLRVREIPPDTTPPSAVVGFNAQEDTDQVNLTWSAATDTVTPQANLVYEIQWGTVPGSYPNTITTPAGSLSYVHTGRDPGVTYYYRIRAKDAAGNYSATYATESATMPVPYGTDVGLAVVVDGELVPLHTLVKSGGSWIPVESVRL